MTATRNSTRPKTTRVVSGDGDSRHGLPSTYANHKCRCEICREGWASYHRFLRERKAAEIICTVCGNEIKHVPDDEWLDDANPQHPRCNAAIVQAFDAGMRHLTRVWGMDN